MRSVIGSFRMTTEYIVTTDIHDVLKIMITDCYNEAPFIYITTSLSLIKSETSVLF